MTPTHLSAAQMRLWANLAVAAIDIETTQHSRGGYRVVEVAVMTSRSRRVSSRWSQLVNPQIRIDAASQKVHGITDEAVASYPVFAEVADTLLRHLTQQAGETLVVVCHNANFDLPILRAELVRAGYDLPTAHVLDTARKFPTAVGVHPPNMSFEALCAELNVPYAPQHQAGGDALSLATVIWELLDRAPDAGYEDIAEILDATGNLTTDRYQKQPRHISPTGRSKIPQQHLDDHAVTLPANPTKTDKKKWSQTLIECAGYRCEDVSDIVAQAEAAPAVLIALFDTALDTVAASQDGPGVATLLAPVVEYVSTYLEDISKTMTRRNQAIKRSRHWRRTFCQLSRCRTGDLCPECLDYLPCPLDTWLDTLAAVAVGTELKPVERFYDTDPSARGNQTKTFYRWVGNEDVEMAWSGIAAVIDYWRSQGDLLRADKVAHYAHEEEGCRHPTVVARMATMVAGPGQLDHLNAAIQICDEALAEQNNSTSVPWVELDRTRRRLDGLRKRASGAHRGGSRSRKARNPRRKHERRFVHTPRPEPAPQPET